MYHAFHSFLCAIYALFQELRCACGTLNAKKPELYLKKANVGHIQSAEWFSDCASFIY